MGYYYDEETGFYYLNSRYYNPDIMRFISIDDSSYLDPYSYKDTNLYVYCYNNPIMFSDPDGCFVFGIFFGIVIGLRELLIGVSILLSASLITSIFILENQYHYISNEISNFLREAEGAYLYAKANKEKYKRKKAAPRIKKKSKKEAKQGAFLKGGKKKPIFHNGKYGPHYHPNDPKFKHWHYYFSILYLLLMQEYDEENEYDELSEFFYF